VNIERHKLPRFFQVTAAMERLEPMSIELLVQSACQYNARIKEVVVPVSGQLMGPVGVIDRLPS
jgi:hypothetical protein